ncbi:MAG: DUF3098 domain-containing protein [Prolixibacteraceae bacterium]|jgi:membrane-bound ClpP family serine protease|nr:DUF3098 domain-containing protein [Prolixibacteraceae bacterium]
MARYTKIEKKEDNFALGRENYILLIIGLLAVVVGFLLMSGGASGDPNVFNPDVFSFRRITLAPMVSLAGYLFIIYAIMKKSKSNNPS